VRPPAPPARRGERGSTSTVSEGRAGAARPACPRARPPSRSRTGAARRSVGGSPTPRGAASSIRGLRGRRRREQQGQHGDDGPNPLRSTGDPRIDGPPVSRGRKAGAGGGLEFPSDRSMGDECPRSGLRISVHRPTMATLPDPPSTNAAAAPGSRSTARSPAPRRGVSLDVIVENVGERGVCSPRSTSSRAWTAWSASWSSCPTVLHPRRPHVGGVVRVDLEMTDEGIARQIAVCFDGGPAPSASPSDASPSGSRTPTPPRQALPVSVRRHRGRGDDLRRHQLGRAVALPLVHGGVTTTSSGAPEATRSCASARRKATTRSRRGRAQGERRWVARRAHELGAPRGERVAQEEARLGCRRRTGPCGAGPRRRRS